VSPGRLEGRRFRCPEWDVLPVDRQQQIEQLRRKISGLVREIVVLSDSQVAPEEFFRQFLARVQSAMEAVAGAVWYVGPGSKLLLAAASDLERIRFGAYVRPSAEPAATAVGEADDDAEDDADAQQRFVQTAVVGVLKEKKPAVLGPTSTDPETSGLPLLLTPILVEDRPAGVLLVAPRPGTDPRALRGMVAFMGEVCRQASRYVQQQRLRALAGLQQHSQHIVALLEQAHASLDPLRVAFALANMGQTMVGCDRLSVARLDAGGRRGRVLAVSGHDVIHRRSTLMKRQGALARRVCAWGATLRNPPPPEADEPPQRVADALALYTQVTRMQSLVVMPLVHEERPVGALIAESKGAEAFTGQHVARLTMVARHGAPAMANAIRYHRLPLLRALALVKGILGRLFGRTVPRVVRRLVLVAVPVLVLIFVPWELTMRAPISVRPEVSRTAFAQTEGIIREVLVTESDAVTAGQELARIDDRGLRAKLKAGQAQLAVQEARLLELSGSDDPSKAAIQRHVVEYHQAWVAFHQRELDKTKILAPIDGVVLTQHPEDLIEKPVKPGEALFRIARLKGDWRLEIELPEKDAGHVLAAQNRLGPTSGGLTVTFYLAAFPQRRFRAVVREIAPQAAIVDQKNVVRVTADLPPEVRSLVKAQMRGEARVHCGKRALGYVLFRGVVDFVRTHLTF